jgi:hypothetical protein
MSGIPLLQACSLPGANAGQVKFHTLKKMFQSMGATYFPEVKYIREER